MIVTRARMRSRKMVLLLAIAALAGSQTASAPSIASQPPDEPSLLNWNQALAAGLPDVAQFLAPAGIPYCTSVNYTFKGVTPTEAPPPDGPACMARPEEQGLRFLPGPYEGPRYGLGPVPGGGRVQWEEILYGT